MNTLRHNYSILMNVVKAAMLIVMLSIGLSASAQNILSTPRTGMIQVLEQDDGYLVISGQRYGYDREVTEVTRQGEEFDDAELQPGMVLRFTVRGGMLATIEVLGPFELLEDIDNH